MNEALSQPKQKAKPLHSTEKENLLRVIGILLEKGHDLGDIRRSSPNKKAELIEAILKERQLKEPKKTTITAIIKNALELIPIENKP